MKTEIYYFSGTGNSLIVAKNIAEKIDGILIPIAGLKSQESITVNAEIVGIVFPVYYGEVPAIVREFAEKLAVPRKTYLFAVCTYGGAATNSLKELKRILCAKDIFLSAAHGVQMPQNSFFKPNENHQKLYDSWEKRLPKIVDTIRKSKCGWYYSNTVLEWLMVPIYHFFIRPICKKSFLKQTDMPKDSKMEDLIREMDIGFFANSKCNGCGVCSKVCPVDNIIMEANKPKWQHHCETCLACYNWCPQKAIGGGITNKDYFYCHPNVSVADIMGQKSI